MPENPPVQTPVSLESSNEIEEVKLGIPMAKGLFRLTLVSFEENYPGSPEWLMEAQFGIWVQFGS